MEKTKKEIKSLTTAIEKVAKTKRQVGDEVTVNDKTCKIVELIGDDRLHCKNLNSPWDSFIIFQNELQ